MARGLPPSLNIQQLRLNFKNSRRTQNIEQAYQIMGEILKLPAATEQDYFSAAECALRLNRYSDAIEYLSNVVVCSQRDGEDYYLNQAYFWRAYSFIKLNKFPEARMDVQRIIQDEGVFYVYTTLPKREVREYYVRDLIEAIELERPLDGPISR